MISLMQLLSLYHFFYCQTRMRAIALRMNIILIPMTIAVMNTLWKKNFKQQPTMTINQ